MRAKNNIIVWGVGVLLATGAVCRAETKYTPERYTVILDRSPFGSDPLTTVTTPDTSAEQRKAAADLEKTCRLSFLLETESGEIRAGFQNLKPEKGKPASSVIRVGESFQGMTLKSVDMVNSEARLEFKGKPITFRLSKAPEKPTTTSRKAPASSRRFGGGFRRATPPAPKKPPEPKRSPEEEKIRTAELRQKMQDYQMEVIRKGMPPLPIPLTPEMDDQLVSEGILPLTE